MKLKRAISLLGLNIQKLHTYIHSVCEQNSTHRAVQSFGSPHFYLFCLFVGSFASFILLYCFIFSLTAFYLTAYFSLRCLWNTVALKPCRFHIFTYKSVFCFVCLSRLQMSLQLYPRFQQQAQFEKQKFEKIFCLVHISEMSRVFFSSETISMCLYV